MRALLIFLSVLLLSLGLEAAPCETNTKKDMSFEGVKIEKQNGAIGTVADTAPTALLIVGGIESAQAVVLGSAAEAEDYGFTAASDSAGGVHVRRHIDQFFAQAPEARLHVIGVVGNTSAGALAAMEYLRAREADAVRVVGVAWNAPAGGFDSADYDEGFYAESLLLGFPAQELVNELSASNRFVDVIAIDARPAAALTAGSLHDFSGDGTPNICFVAGHELPATTNRQYATGFGDVGAFLGSLCVRSISESVASVDIELKPAGRKAELNYPLRGLANRWANAGFGGYAFEAIPASLKTELDEKRVILAGMYPQTAGVFWGSSDTATTPNDDYNTIERNAVWNACAAAVAEALTPKIKSKIALNTDGTIRNTTIEFWRSLVDKKLKAMQDATHISAYSFTIAAAQNVVETGKIATQLTIVPVGIAHEITGAIGFATQV